jgi:Raf kinase inhibitor-like YbhB/YbcL family protein
MRTMQSVVICAILSVGFAAPAHAGQPGQAPPPVMPSKPGFTLTTPAFDDGGIIPAKYTHSVPNPVSPKLEWTNVPENTASFTLIVHDLNVSIQKTSEDALHWVAVNIPGSARELPEGVPATAQLPDGTIQLKILRGMVGFMGPGAPAVGPYHHYTFEIYALDTKLDLGPDATRADVLKAMDGHILAKAVMGGRFHR